MPRSSFAVLVSRRMTRELDTNPESQALSPTAHMREGPGICMVISQPRCFGSKGPGPYPRGFAINQGSVWWLKGRIGNPELNFGLLTM